MRHAEGPYENPRLGAEKAQQVQLSTRERESGLFTCGVLTFRPVAGVIGAILSHKWASREVGQSKAGAASAQTQVISSANTHNS